jgi:phosphoglycerol transferase MdoB-like AlkP superfamily enzyme
MSMADNSVAPFWHMLGSFGPYTPLAALFVIGLVFLTLSRVGLMLWQKRRVAATGIWPQMLAQGLRVDVIMLSLVCLLPMLMVPLTAFEAFWPVWQKFTFFWVVAAATLLFFLEAATPGFIAEYDVRPNRLFVEYLKYPKEVCSMLWRGFRAHVFFGLIITGLTIWLMSRFMQPWLVQQNSWGIAMTLLTWPLVFLLLAFAIRSSTGHRPANPAMFALTTDSMVNSLILDSAWSVSHAVYNLKHESKSSEIYGKMPNEAMLRTVNEYRVQTFGAAPFIVDGELPTLNRLVPSRQRERPLNLVIVLEESLGATFVESLGGLPVTPELEKLKQYGWWFEQLYATGTRSVRGIEAVVTGFAPTPAQSVVKLSLSQQNFFSLADLLGRRGYHTEFIYGGESHFDNMNGFFMGNGFQAVIDQKDYESPVLVGSWGVSDEDLFNKAHEQISAHHAQGKPFFTLVFSSSNHSPFEFPDGRIELYDDKKATENNAVKYADYALGKFFEQARASDYWQDTLFIVVADHDIRVRGDSLVPIKNFHIPALILGADLEPRNIKTVASQLDLPVTALSLMGIEADHPMTGRDISSELEDIPGRAMMQFEQHYAWMEGQQTVVLRPGKPPVHAIYNPQVKRLNIGDAPANGDSLEQRALAHVLLPDWLYRKQRYRLAG